MIEKKSTNKPLVYVPDGAKINNDNKPMNPPPIEYEERRVIFDREEIKKNITKKDIP